MKKPIKATALKYSKENLDVPVIAAIGSGELAEKIIEKAKENGIKIVENSEFYDFENIFKLGEEIPPEVYGIVVEILKYILYTNIGENNV